METGGPLHGIQTGFSPGNDFLAVAYADGSLKTFDTARGAICVSTGGSGGSRLLPGKGQAHSSPVTSLAWLHQVKQGQRLEGSSAVVLGHADGGLSAIDAITGDNRWTAADCHSGAVGAVAATPSGQSVHSVGTDGQLRTSGTQNGAVEHTFHAGKGVLTAMGLAPDGATALLGGDSLSHWRLHPPKRLQKLTGHPAPVRSIAFAPGGRFAATAAQGERHIVLWDLGGPKVQKQDGKRPKRAAAGLLSADEPAHALVLGVAETAGDFLVAAVMQSGQLNVWSCLLDDKQRLQGSHLAASRPASSPVLAARFVSTTEMLVAHGSASKPTIQHVSIPTSAAAGVRELELTAQEVALVAGTSSRKKAKAAAAQAAAVGPEPIETAPAQAQGVASSAKRKREQAPAATPAGNGAVDPDEDESEDDVMDGPTFQERLAAAGLSQDRETEEPGSLLPQGTAAVQAGSLATVLSQALQAQDSLLLERCLKVTKASVVIKTVQGLSPLAALQLLSAAADRLQSRPTRGQSMSTWLRPLLLHHASYLMNAPGAQPALAKLYRTIEVQVAHQAALSSLAGRLDLLCAQIPAASGKQDVVYQPQVVYDESLEVEDALNPAAVERDAEDMEDLSDAEEDDDLSDA